MKNRKLQVWLPLLFGIVMALGMLTGFQLAGNSGNKSKKDARLNRSGVQEVIDLLEFKYVDSISIDSLQQDGIEAMLKHLDPHTVYIPKQDLSEVNADLQGEFSGIGVEYLMINDTMNIVYVVEKGPSEKAGLQTGDQIIKVYDKEVAGKKLKGNELRKMIRGEYNTEVELTILSNGTAKKVKVTRGSIPLPSVDAYYMAAPATGYIRLNKFSETTYKEFMDAATTLQRQGMKKMILDLRGNSGGILSEATNIADELLEDGLALVSTKGLHVKNKEINSNKPGLFEEGPLVVLQDEFSASASEVLAGALQDNDRGIIVGRRSFGKGLVQEQYDLSNGGALRITVARYYTPTGRSIQKPYNGNRTEYMEEVIGRHSKKDSSNKATGQQEVYTTRKGRKLYGGGGITPDVEIAFDTTQIPASAVPLYNNSLVSDFSFQIFKANQQHIRNFKTLSAYNKLYSLPASTWENFLQQAQKDSIQIGNIPASVKADLLLRIKANVARYVWRNTGYFLIMQPSDKLLLQALSTIQKQ